MNTYLVTWYGEAEAETPQDAARAALLLLQDPDPDDAHFEVEDTKTGVSLELNAAWGYESERALYRAALDVWEQFEGMRDDPEFKRLRAALDAVMMKEGK